MYCVFNGHNLDDGNNYQTLSIDAQPSKADVNKYSLVRSDGVVVTSKQYGERTILIKGRILATNQIEADDRLDTFNSFISATEKDLLIEVGSTKRKYIATIDSVSITKTGYHYEWELNIIANSFGADETSTTLTLGTYTTSPTSYNNTIGGSYKTKPILDMTINSVAPYWTNQYLQVENVAESQVLRLTRTWNYLDRVIIDGDAKTVSLYASDKTIVDLCDVATGWTSSHTISLEESLMKEGVGCLKNVMATAHDHVDFIRLNSTSVDLSSTMGTLLFWVFIPSETAGTVSSLEFVAGSDATLANNYSTWGRNTQYDGSALVTGAWNLIGIDLSTTPTDTGTPVRTAILSIKVSILGTDATMRLVGALLDYITIHKASVTSEALDYEGIFPDLNVGVTTLTFTDEFTNRNITITGEYNKKYL